MACVPASLSSGVVMSFSLRSALLGAALFSAQAAAVEFTFVSGNPAPEAFGNSYTQTLDGLTTTVTAWSTTGRGGRYQTAELEIYTGYGMGVCSRSEGVNCSSSGNMHALDNEGADDLILFRFSSAVQLDSLTLRQFGGDSDLSIWAGSGSLNLDGAETRCPGQRDALQQHQQHQRYQDGGPVEFCRHLRLARRVGTPGAGKRFCQAAQRSMFRLSPRPCPKWTTGSCCWRAWAWSDSPCGDAADGMMSAATPERRPVCSTRPLGGFFYPAPPITGTPITPWIDWLYHVIKCLISLIFLFVNPLSGDCHAHRHHPYPVHH